MRTRKKNDTAANMRSNFDVLGSYTGRYLAGDYEEPVQDADDL